MNNGQPRFALFNQPELLQKTFSEFSNINFDVTEQKLIEIIENVYKEYPPENREGFAEALQQYQLSQKLRLEIMDSKNIGRRQFGTDQNE